MRKILFIIFLIFAAFQFYIWVWLRQDYHGQYVNQVKKWWHCDIIKDADGCTPPPTISVDPAIF